MACLGHAARSSGGFSFTLSTCFEAVGVLLNASEVLMAEDTISVPSEEAKHRTQTERRAWVRLPTSQAVSCQPIAASTPDTGWLGKLVNISPGGLALLLSRRFEPGTLLIVELPSKAQRRARTVGVRVVHAKPEKDTCWILGCEIISPLTEDDMQSLVGG
jgi:hypothetical protein